MTDNRRWLDKTLDTLKKAGEAAKDGVHRTYQVSTLKLELASLRRSLDDVTRDVGRSAVDALREKGQLTAEQVAPLLRRIDDLEDQIATKERQVADLETDDASPAAPEGMDPLDQTVPLSRKRPGFTSGSPGGPPTDGGTE